MPNISIKIDRILIIWSIIINFYLVWLRNFADLNNRIQLIDLLFYSVNLFLASDYDAVEKAIYGGVLRIDAE